MSHPTNTNNQTLNDEQKKLIIKHIEFTKQQSMANQKNYSHVPCKFFKQGNCQAGNTCPFSHSLDINKANSTPCKYFKLGNCKFGSKCANAHILPDGTIIQYNNNNNRQRQNKFKHNNNQPSPHTISQQYTNYLNLNNMNTQYYTSNAPISDPTPLQQQQHFNRSTSYSMERNQTNYPLHPFVVFSSKAPPPSQTQTQNSASTYNYTSSLYSALGDPSNTNTNNNYIYNAPTSNSNSNYNNINWSLSNNLLNMKITDDVIEDTIPKNNQWYTNNNQNHDLDMIQDDDQNLDDDDEDADFKYYSRETRIILDDMKS